MKEIDIPNLIQTHLRENEYSLEQIEDIIEKEHNAQLNVVDRVYMEKRYIKYCLQYFTEEIDSLLKEPPIDSSIVEELIDLNNINYFAEISHPFNELKYYKILVKHADVIKQHKEEVLVRNFKEKCLELSAAHSKTVTKEIDFLNTFLEFLSMFGKCDEYPDMSNLQGLYKPNISSDEFFEIILNLEVANYDIKLKRLQYATQSLIGQKHISLMDKYREIIGAYFKPIAIEKLMADNRVLVEVIGGNFHLSKIIKDINSLLSCDSHIQEVRFICSGIMYIDENLHNITWHGKNIVVYAKTIMICGDYKWDVSGKSADPTEINKAETDDDGEGIDGEHGKCGESGGNVFIHADKMSKPQNLQIISNGGDGSDGQNGGDGKDGKDGMGIFYADFNKKFPTSGKFIGTFSVKNLKTIVKNMIDLGKVEVSWQNGDNCSTKDILHTGSRSDTYMEIVTNNGQKIYFSSSTGGETFILYKGSLGRLGGHAGDPGLGGQRGYPGEIISNNPGIVKFGNPGKNGKNGKEGKCGTHGENGWDMAYIDWLFWSREIHYGTSENKRLELSFHEKSNSERIYVPYCEKKSSYKYAQISETSIPKLTSTTYAEKQKSSARSERQTQAERKKNISHSHIFSQYSMYMLNIDTDLFQNLQKQMKNNEKQAVEKILENKKQQMKEISKVAVTRKKPSAKRNARVCNANYPISSAKPEEAHRISLEDLLKNLREGSLDEWFKLGNEELEYSHFNYLLKHFEEIKNKHAQTNHHKTDSDVHDNQLQLQLKNIEKLLINKYHLAVLQQITWRMANYQYIDSNKIEITPKNAIKYFRKNKINPHVNLGMCKELGNLQQYFFEDNELQRKKISQFCTTENVSKFRDAFKYSIASFVMDEGKEEKVHPNVKKYYKDYSKFVNKQEKKLKKFCEQSKLNVASCDIMIHRFFQSLNNTTVQTKLKEDAKKDKQLKTLYERFTQMFSESFTWDDCINDPDIFKNYVQHIKLHGPLSPSYRELLAYIFDVNICMYITDQNNQVCLLDVHNPQCTNTIYLLYANMNYTLLDINQDFLRLDMERNGKANVTSKIIAKVASLQRKSDIDEYMKKELFFSESMDEEPTTVEDIDEKMDMYEIIRHFSFTEEKQKLRFLLEKISSRYIGQPKVLHALAKCFSNDGMHITYDELYCLVNAVLNFVIEDHLGLNVFVWIIMAYPQRQWLNEIILLKLENHFQMLLIKTYEWRAYLENIHEKETLLLLSSKLEQNKLNKTFSTSCINNILYLLNNITERVPGLCALELSEWPYVIKEKYWITKLSIFTEWQDEDLQRASYYLLSLENSAGISLVDRFMNLLIKKNVKLESSTSLMSSISSLWKGKDNTISIHDFLQILSSFHNGEWNFSKDVLTTLSKCKMNKWLTKMKEIFPTDEKDRDTNKLIQLIQGNGNTSESILNNLYAIKDTIQAMKRIKTTSGEEIEDKIMEHRQKIKLQEKESDKLQYVRNNVAELLGLIDNAINLKKKFRLRDAQKLAILTLFENERSTLLQVSTGEGKSLIVVGVAILKALCDQKVDIITSSSVLAKRDAEDNGDIYELFFVSVSHNCDNDVEKRKEVYSCKNVVYGDLSGFQRDYLLDRFYGENILGDRSFENVVIDEVDSMLLDKGSNTLYLSHDLPSLDKLEFVYVYIWQLINKPFASEEQFLQVFDTKVIKQAVLRDIHGLLSKEDIKKIDTHINGQQLNTIWERLIKHDIIDSDGYLLKDDVSEADIKKISSSERYERRLLYLFNEISKRKKFILVPNYLKPFIALHLDSWINSAKTALLMQERQDYIVDVDRKAIKPELKANITIIDRDTGTDQTNSEWDEALHQFLQLKHGCKLSMQSLKAVFVSNVSYLKLYNNLYGLTGTLGSQRERDLLRDIYEVDFVTVPTTKTKKFKEYNPFTCSSLQEWSHQIRTEAETYIKDGRSMLIICETVQDVESLCRVLDAKNATNIYTYTRDYESFDVFADNKRLRKGQIIIATNLAGRGTDIKITDELNEAGGLHVCLTYLPKNNRVEQQAFGRAARCGNNGSGRLIILGTQNIHSISQTSHLKKQRDFEEIRRISDIKLHYETRISSEESAFSKFKEVYTFQKMSLEKSSANDEIKEMLLRSCLDEWAFWLDENSKYISNTSSEQDTDKYKASLSKLIDHLRALKPECDSWVHWTREPTQIIKLAKYFARNKDQDKAIELFDRVIKEEPDFSESAHYYKAYSLIKKYNKTALQQNLKEELHKASKLMEKHRDYALMAGNIIDVLKQKNPGIIQIDAFKEQHKNIGTLYQIFLQSINDILGDNVTSQNFERYDINEDLAETLYLDLMKNDILKKPRISKNIKEDNVKRISEQYGIIWKKLNNFLYQIRDSFINLQQFEKNLKKSVKLPNKEDFWKLLVKEKILINEVKYVKIVVKKLQNIDPSLLKFLNNTIEEKRLEKQTLTCDEKQLLLNMNVAEQNNEEDIILEKEQFKVVISNKKYKVLKQRNVFTYNKKATFDSGNVDSVTFPFFDSITLEDLTERNISEEDVRQILTDLVEQKFLANEEKGHYRLIVTYDKIANIELPSCPIYKPFIIQLLNVCFKYRITLQKLLHDFQNEIPINLQLTTKPYQSLICSLMDEKVIKLSKVSNKKNDLENKLRSTYKRVLNGKDVFMDMLCKNNLVSQKRDTELCNYIVQQKWIDIKDTTENVMNDDERISENLYNQTTNEQDKIVLLVDKDTLRAIREAADYKGPKETIKAIIDARNYLGKRDTINHIVNTLENLRNVFKTLNVPDCNMISLLKHIESNEFFKSSDYPSEELHVFAVNGLDDLLKIQEQKWSWKMIFNVAPVVILGIMQIVLANVIEVLSAGTMTCATGALLSKGINDIFVAISNFRNEYFSWEDYMYHKVMSLVTTGLTFGLGTLLSSAENASSYASGIVEPGVSSTGGEVAEMTGRQLLNKLSCDGSKLLTREFTKRVAMSTMEGVAFGLRSAKVDWVINNYLQNLCSNIKSSMMTEIYQAVEQHDISHTLSRAYQMLGRQNASITLEDITRDYFAISTTSELSRICNKLMCILMSFVKQSRSIRSTNINSFSVEMLLNLIGPASKILKTATVLYDLKNLTDEMLNALNNKILEKLNEVEAENELGIQENYDAMDMNRFKCDITEMWKTMLHARARQVIDEEIVRPVMHSVATIIVNYVDKQRQRMYNEYKECNYFEQFQQCKVEYEEKLQDLKDAPEQVLKQVEREYQNNLKDLLMKTCSPKLFADIVRENLPMNTTCAAACLPVIQSMLENHGIDVKGLTLFVEEMTGLSAKISTRSDGEEGAVIRILLEDGHFRASGNDTSNNANDSPSCLYESLCQRLPELKDMTAEEFRTKMADGIEASPDVQDRLFYGWDQFKIGGGLFSGASYDNELIRTRCDQLRNNDHSNMRGNRFQTSFY